MKLSYEWLKEYVKVKAPAEEVAHKLTMSGSEVEAVQNAGSDKVMDLEITSNRPDCLSIIGLAREVSTVFDQDLEMPELKIPKKKAGEKGPAVECAIKDPALCPRYTARVITGVRVAPSGEYIKDRITAMGLRPVNNIVDITNYCLMELGQPLHAFDLDRIKGGKVLVREAKKGEKIVTIDGIERELEKGMLVIADAERAIAVAGVMGGIDTEVGAATKNILLESAYFDPISVRQTARKLGLGSESSYRFERGVDKGMIEGASNRAAMLILGEAGGRICEFHDRGKLRVKKKTVTFDAEKAGRILGISLDKKKAKKILTRLGASVKAEGGRMTVAPPSFREDLAREVDLIEEVARIYGYDNIPETTTRTLFRDKRKGHDRLAAEKIRSILSMLGLNEIMTYSLVNEAAVKIFPALAEGAPVELSNPLSEEQRFMTPHLLDGMFRSIAWNINRDNKSLKLFEIGKAYSGSGKKFRETPVLCIGVTGLCGENWQEGARESGFYDVKGMAEALISGVKLEAEIFPGRAEGMAACAEVKIRGDNKRTGILAQVGDKVLKKYDIKQPVFICQLALDGIYGKMDLKDRYHSVTKFPFTSRDMSVLCDKRLPAGDIFMSIRDSGEEMIRDIKLSDVYEGEQLPAGKKSLTFSILYGLGTRTLKDEEVEAVHSQIKEALSKKLGVSFR